MQRIIYHPDMDTEIVTQEVSDTYTLEDLQRKININLTEAKATDQIAIVENRYVRIYTKIGNGWLPGEYYTLEPIEVS